METLHVGQCRTRSSLRSLQPVSPHAPGGWDPGTCLVLEKTLESLLDCKEIQSVHPKGNQFEYSLEGLMLKLKLQYFSHLMQRTDSFEKTLMLRRIEGMREGDDRMRWLEGITDSMDRSK